MLSVYLNKTQNYMLWLIIDFLKKKIFKCVICFFKYNANFLYLSEHKNEIKEHHNAKLQFTTKKFLKIKLFFK
jgi:hypothetical protein